MKSKASPATRLQKAIQPAMQLKVIKACISKLIFRLNLWWASSTTSEDSIGPNFIFTRRA